MVIDNNDVIFKGCFLLQCTPHGINNRFLTVSYGYNHRSLHVEVLLIEVGTLIIACIHQGTYGVEMSRSHMLHLYLHLTVGGIDIVKLLHSTRPEVSLFLGVKIFVYMQYIALSA